MTLAEFSTQILTQTKIPYNSELKFEPVYKPLSTHNLVGYSFTFGNLKIDYDFEDGWFLYSKDNLVGLGETLLQAQLAAISSLSV